MEVILLTLIISLIGLFVGGFINAMILRNQKSLPLTGRSRCLVCEEPIQGADLIPIVSYVLLKGRCRHCAASIEWQYPVLELFTGIIFALFFIQAFIGHNFPAFVNDGNWLLFLTRNLVIATFLLILLVYDSRYFIIPDKFSLPPIILAILFNISLGADVSWLLLGGLLIGFFFAFQFLISSGRWIGAGDIRLGLLTGFLLGPLYGAAAIVLAYILGALIGLLLIILKQKTWYDYMPLGSFIAIGNILMMLWGPRIIEWYFGFF
ncbi:prepilin peptidase [Candidatus Parcubacteria bacterium]|nr:MAG: prepilin peptidase [Candidatus Parcubacteria bacterium]